MFLDSMSGVNEYLVQHRVVVDRSAAVAVEELAKGMGCESALIVASSTLARRTSEVAKIQEGLGLRCVGVYDRCVAGVPRESALELASEMRELAPDVIVVVGGGSVTDTVKMALIAVAHGITHADGFDDYRIRVGDDGLWIAPSPSAPQCGLITVPTTLSGAPFSDFAACTDRERRVKDMFVCSPVANQVVVLDSEITRHTPDSLWFSSGAIAVSHAVETVCSRSPQSAADSTSILGLEMLAKALVTSHKATRDLSTRLDALIAVCLASVGRGRIEWGAGHGLVHQLTAAASTSLGRCSCAVLPSVLAWNRKVNAVRQELVAKALGRTDGDAAQAVADLFSALGLPGSLRDAGVRREHFAATVAAALQDMNVQSNPRPIRNESDIEEILELAW